MPAVTWADESSLLPGATSQDYDLDGLKHDQHVQPDRRVLYVIQIVLQFLASVLQRIAVLVLHLCPTRYARSNRMAHTVIGNLFAQPRHEFRTLRPRSHEMHVAL